MDAVRQIPNYMSTEQNRRVSQVVRDMGRGLMRFIRARVPSDADAEDVMQDVWHQLVTTLNAGAVEQIGAWLYTVARNRIIDRYRKPRIASLEAMALSPRRRTWDLISRTFFCATTTRRGQSICAPSFGKNFTRRWPNYPGAARTDARRNAPSLW